MKINLSNEVDKRTFLGGIIVNSITDSILDQLEQKQGIGIVADLVLTVNGHELNLERFVACWESQVNDMIAVKAEEFLTDKFSSIISTLEELEDRLKPELYKRMDMWEKENYDKKR